MQLYDALTMAVDRHNRWVNGAVVVMEDGEFDAFPGVDWKKHTHGKLVFDWADTSPLDAVGWDGTGKKPTTEEIVVFLLEGFVYDPYESD